MGDIVHALPAVASLKQGFPGAHLTWVIEPQWAALLEANPFVDLSLIHICLGTTSYKTAWKTLE